MNQKVKVKFLIKDTDMQWFYKRLLPLMIFPLLVGCEHAVQTWVFAPDVKRETESQCYQTKGIKLVPWANEVVSEKNLKPLFKTKKLTKAQKKELIYSRINKEDVADEDPLNSRHSGLVLVGVQNILSIPITSMIAATEVPALKREYRACMWKVTLDSASQNIERQNAAPLENFHVKAMEGEEEILTKPPA